MRKSLSITFISGRGLTMWKDMSILMVLSICYIPSPKSINNISSPVLQGKVLLSVHRYSCQLKKLLVNMICCILSSLSLIYETEFCNFCSFYYFFWIERAYSHLLFHLDPLLDRFYSVPMSYFTLICHFNYHPDVTHLPTSFWKPGLYLQPALAHLRPLENFSTALKLHFPVAAIP